jgi:pilus assembly protein CpaB
MRVNLKKLRIALTSAILMVLVMLVFQKSRASWFLSSSDPGEMVPVLVADRYIPAFTVIKPEWVRAMEFPKAFVPPGALRAKSDLNNENGQMLFTSAISIPEGQPVTRALVTDASQNDTLGGLIRPGKVAVSFEIDKAHGVGGWIRPGDRVAVFGATPMSINGSKSLGKKTRLLYPSVVVVAVDDKRLGQNPEKASDTGTDAAVIPELAASNGAKIITVLVSPTEASTIIEAREDGSLSVVLRSLGDDIPWPPAK